MGFFDSARPSRNNMWPCTIAALWVGLVAEVIQFFTPGRFATLFDIGLNLVGIVFALAAYRWYRQKMQS